MLKSLQLLRTMPRSSCFSSRDCLTNYGHYRHFATERSQNITSSRQHLISTMLALTIATGFSAYFLIPDISRAAPTSENALLAPAYFIPATVVSTEASGPDTKLMKLSIPSHLVPRQSDESEHLLNPIWSIFIKDDDIQVERPYTPLEGITSDGQMLFWIKKYPKGEVGRWLHSKNVGDRIDIRGPLTTWEWREDTWDEVIMISGGTGITPFIQLFHEQISKPSSSSNTRFTLLHSSRTPGELPPSDILDPLVKYAARNPDKLRVNIFVDFDDGSSTPIPITELRVGRINRAAIDNSLNLNLYNSWLSWNMFSKPKTMPNSQRRVLFLVCGPEPMVNAISGPFGRNFSQGLVGGVLGDMGFSTHQVRKL